MHACVLETRFTLVTKIGVASDDVISEFYNKNRYIGEGNLIFSPYFSLLGIHSRTSKGENPQLIFTTGLNQA